MSPRGDDRHAVTTQPAETTGTWPSVALGAQRAQVRPSIVDGDNHPGRKKKETRIIHLIKLLSSDHLVSVTEPLLHTERSEDAVAGRLFDFSHVAGSGGMGGGRGRGGRLLLYS